MGAGNTQQGNGRYVLQWIAEPGNAVLHGFTAWQPGRGGRYSGALSFKGREDELRLPTDAAGFERLMGEGLPALPKVLP